MLQLHPNDFEKWLQRPYEYMQEFFALKAMCCVCFSLLDDSREKMSDKSKLVTQKVTDVWLLNISFLQDFCAKNQIIQVKQASKHSKKIIVFQLKTLNSQVFFFFFFKFTISPLFFKFTFFFIFIFKFAIFLFTFFFFFFFQIRNFFF